MYESILIQANEHIDGRTRKALSCSNIAVEIQKQLWTGKSSIDAQTIR